MIVSFPPCNICLKKILEDKTIKWEIYYLFDDVRKKIDKGYWDNFKKTNTINQFSILENKSLIFEIYYIIMICLGGFLRQKRSYEEEEIELKKTQRNWKKL